MKLKGFSLAEILITMSIIGVVAALTIPVINTNIQISDMEARYAKIVRDLENANQFLLADREAKTLQTACGISDDDTQFNQASAYLNTLSRAYNLTGGINPRAVQYDVVGQNIPANTAWYYLSADGDMALFPRNAEIGDLSDYYQVFVDLNGPNRAPNRMGRDLHLFVIDKIEGDVAGYGSSQMTPFAQGGSMAGDRSSANCNENRISEVLTCTGSITDNGGRIVYDFNRL